MVFPLLLALCSPLPTCADLPPAPFDAVVLQNISKNAGYTIPSTLTFPYPNVAGTTLVVAIRAGTHRDHSFTVTDSLGNSYTKVGQFEMTLDVESLAIYAAQNAVAGSNTVTLADSTTAGATRWAVLEISGLGPALAPSMVGEGNGTAVSTPSPGDTGDFVLTLVGTRNDTSFTLGPNGVFLNEEVKFFLEHSSSSATLSPAEIWGALSVSFAGGGPSPICATPTPVVMWNAVVAGDLAGYRLYYSEVGGVFQTLIDFPCEQNPDGSQLCRGVYMGAPLQRYCPGCAPFTEYQFAVKAYNAVGDFSTAYSNVVTVCFSPICVSPGPCN